MTDQPLFVLSVGNQPSMLFGGPHHGTEYSLEHACSRCGTGAEQIGPLRLGGFRPPRAQMFTTLDSEMLVQRELADRLRAGGIDALSAVVDSRSGQPLDLFHLRPVATLPAFAPESSGITRERPCPVCGRDGYYAIPHVPYRLEYPALDPALRAKDVVATYERFGTSVLRLPFKDSVFAAPLFIVSDRLRSLLSAAKVRNLRFDPVVLP